jgi:hypothetical protein
MPVPYTPFSDPTKEVQPPAKGILRRTLIHDDRLKGAPFGLAAPDRKGYP